MMLVLTKTKRRALRRTLTYYVGPWQWRDDCWHPPQGCVGTLDLRSNPQCGTPEIADGVGMFAMPSHVALSSEYESFGSNLHQPQPSQCQRRFASMLHCGRSGNDLASMLWDALTIHADPSGEERSRPIVPTVAGEFELWFVGRRLQAKRFRHDAPESGAVQELLRRDYRAHRLDSIEGRTASNLYKKILGYWVLKYGVNYRWFQPADVPDEEPVEPTTTITETWPTNSTTVSSGQDNAWTETFGDVDVSSNRLRNASAAAAFARCRCDTDLSSSDNYAQIVVSTPSTNTARYAAPICRYSSAADSGYAAQQLGAASDPGSYRIAKLVTGTFTLLFTGTTQTRAGTKKVDASGSTITAYHAGSSVESSTDSSLATGTRCGVAFNGTNAAFFADDFEAGDLAAPTGNPWNYYAQAS